MSSKHPGLRTAVAIAILYFVFWFVFMVLMRDAKLIGVPLITWSQIFLGLLAIGLSIALTFKLDKWEKKEK